MPGPKATLTRRELLAGAGAGAAALLLEPGGLQAQTQPPSRRPVVFSHTTVVNADAVQHDVASRRRRATGSRRSARAITILKTYAQAPRSYDGRGKALVPGLDQLPRASRRHAPSAASTRISDSRIPRVSPSARPASFRERKAR